MRSRIALTLVIATTTIALAAGAGSAAPSAKWARISGPAQPGAQLGLARTADGVLHVIWNRGATPTSIFETRLSPAGKVAGTSTVATGWDGNGGLALLVMPDKTLRLFAAGATYPGSSAFGINTFTAPTGGGTWTLEPGLYWGGAVANAAGAIGADARKGRPACDLVAWLRRGGPSTAVPAGRATSRA